MTNNKQYRVLLFYKYVQIEDHEYFAKKHLKFCKELGLKGRILVAEEGINGTVSGTIEQTEAYMKHMHEDVRFHDIWFKIDEAEGHTFKKMHVRPRSELVTLKLEDDHNPNEVGGKHLSAKEWNELLKQAMEDEDIIILDTRNDYEYELGHFRGAIRPDIKSFRELPEWIEENLGDKKDKKILTYCTGGIRCEKFTGYMVNQGYKDVNQLHGGIVSYGKDSEAQGEFWDGKCFVFDDRLAVDINRTSGATILTNCHYCGKPEYRYVNCANPECDYLHISCKECEERNHRSCSAKCKEHPENLYRKENMKQEV
ncbi:rhodanese-related sulfurtransferase [Bacillus taeanensis]|uniref:tRNA uridine(34) hydroxylase n=1 Tax=Bacillus taeanensis TaxID=273032 RepID=A0A366XSY6_9BACI|nr:rhodanese-related sulfurtransferase [Bacillus taeanensis]RBW69490.1 rhodanese-related sulfurtransferase [Bacillus taeanensis]